MHITIINDCKDENAKGRQVARAASLMDAPVSFIGVTNDLEAAGNLVDILDAYGEGAGVILVNVAPRHGTSRKWGNGTPFAYFRHKKVLVLASIEGLTLSLVKKLGLVDSVCVLDIPTAVAHMAMEGALAPELVPHIEETQFRSFEFLPRAAQFLLEHEELPHTKEPLDEFPDAPYAVWFVDNFGNCKTTMLQNGYYEDPAFYTHLKDVPDDKLAVVRGSSGIGNKRFLELVVQGQDAAKTLGLTSGARIDP